MFLKSKKYWLLFLVLALFAFDSYIFYYDWQNSHREFTFAMLDVGQGDALFLESPSGVQILIDGGPPRKIMKELSKVISPFDRKIDGLIITNPDQDHIAGFLEVLDAYEVDFVFEPGTLNESKVFQNLKDELTERGIPLLLAKKGMKLDMGEGVYLDILFPDRDVSSWSTNDGSVISRASYGNISILLTGDSTYKTEKILLDNYTKSELESSILKVAHHGSRTSTSPELVTAVSPSYALISNGLNNKYGHPHPETTETLDYFNIKTLRTDTMGTILLKSDGKNFNFSFK